jgi:serine/threonine-protein kinase
LRGRRFNHTLSSSISGTVQIQDRPSVESNKREAAVAPGDKLGDFEVISELWRGEMGVVYAARDRKLGRIAALKLLPSHFHLDSEATRRLIEEAQAASELDHPNLATIYQVGETENGRRFIAMARYEGETLRERLSRGPILPREAFDIARQIAAGLAAAHSIGLVHRDVKPENIFLTKTGLAKLLELGIATIDGSAREDKTTRGTVQYMSPEQARRQSPGRASDVWSLGVVLYEMLAGQPPFTGHTPRELLGQIGDHSPIRLPAAIRKLPRVASASIDRALQKEENRRFRNASEFLSSLETAQRLWFRPRIIRIAAVAIAVVTIIAVITARSRTTAIDETRALRLAVLPVTGDSSDTESAALASALGDEIAARIVGLGRMRLVRADADSIVRIAPKRGLHFLRLELAHDSSIPAITVSLEHAESHRIIWSARRLLNSGDLREISREFVIATLNAVGRPVTARERATIGSSFPSNGAAYEEYLRGNQLLAIRTPSSLEAAIVSFRNAARLDTTFAAALARQAYAYTVLVDWGWKPTPSFPVDLLGEGLELADHATRLDSTSADPWLARAYILVQKDPAHFAGAIDAFQHAIALDPYNPEAFHQYGETLMVLGRYTEALAAFRRVLNLEPDRAMTLVPMAAITKRLGRKLEALSYLDSAVAANPEVPYVRATRALLRAQLGDIKGARADAEAGIAMPSGYKIPQLGVLVRVLVLDGDTALALKLLAEAERNMPNPDAPSPTDVFWLGVGEVSVGHIAKAEQLLRTVKPRGAVAWFMLQADELQEFRKIPEVSAQLNAMDPRRVVQ